MRRLESHRTQPGPVLAAAIVCLLVVPSLASAQAIGGAVTDGTGGVLPGVTVEARSPALIEQVRAVVTDGSGQYRIVGLETGTYSVTFTLAGFSTLVREGIELSVGFTANVNVQLSVGSIEETITVTQASPTIDIQSVEQRTTIDREIIEAIPTGRTHDSLALLIPAIGVTAGFTTSLATDSGGIQGRSNSQLTIHGSAPTDAQYDLDGMSVDQISALGTPQGMTFDTNVAEFSYDYSGMSAEVEGGGVRLNMIPREGSNTFTTRFFADFSWSDLLANNVTEDLIDRGLVGGKDGGTKLDEAWMVAPSVGGPIATDRLWFFLAYSHRVGSLIPANLFHSQDTSALVYVPDLTRPTADRQRMYEASLRLTWQATSKDKVTAYYSNNHNNQAHALTGSFAGLFIAPEAGNFFSAAPNTYQATWVRPQTSSILFEAGASVVTGRNKLEPAAGAVTTLPAVLNTNTLTMSRNMGGFFGGNRVRFSFLNYSVRGAVSFVTGRHNLKVGVITTVQKQTETYGSDASWTNYRTRDLGLGFQQPVQAVFDARPSETNHVVPNMGIYAQEQFTLDRLTINAGVRFDYFKATYPDHLAEAMTWAPEPRFFPGAPAVTWKDLQPRLGAVYDLRGDGRTALKVSASRYGDRNSQETASALNPAGNNVTQDRTWLDGAFGICIPPTACVPGDLIVQGDPLNPLPNGELLSVNTNPAFGTPIVTRFYDPDWAFGWGQKAANWEFSGGIQHEVTSGVSVDVSYFRRNYVNFSATDDRAVGPEDYDEFVITVAEDPRLPGGGGFPVTLVDLKPAAALRVDDDITTSANNYAGETQTWNGVDATVNVRIGGLLFQGGISTGKTSTDDCAQEALLPENIGGGGPVGFCKADGTFLTQSSFSGAYTLPYDIRVSGSFFVRPGPPRTAIYDVPPADILAALGRPATRGRVNINVIEPRTEYGELVNQLDLRFGKSFTFGGARLQANFDLYNVFNAAAVSGESQAITIGQPGYLSPLGIQAGRLGKFSVQLDF